MPCDLREGGLIWLDQEFQCGTCGKEFSAGSAARDKHCEATGHRPPAHECQRCSQVFHCELAVMDHMAQADHFRFSCAVCGQTSPHRVNVVAHEALEHLYCHDCNRRFINLNAIKMHLKSRIHRGETLSCPLCRKAFATATGIATHHESGACPKARNLNRDTVYRVVRSKDPRGLISKKQLGWSGSPVYEASEKTWNGDFYECYLCHREFTKLQGLNQHLNSPIHQQALYHCPNRSCQMDFKSLASIINHLESEACGLMRFEQVQKQMADIVSSNRRIEYHFSAGLRN